MSLLLVLVLLIVILAVFSYGGTGGGWYALGPASIGGLLVLLVFLFLVFHFLIPVI